MASENSSYTYQQQDRVKYFNLLLSKNVELTIVTDASTTECFAKITQIEWDEMHHRSMSNSISMDYASFLRIVDFLRAAYNHNVTWISRCNQDDFPYSVHEYNEGLIIKDPRINIDVWMDFGAIYKLLCFAETGFNLNFEA